MKAAPFRYERPRELKQALELLEDPDSKAIAGGQSLVPMMAMRLARPRILVDLRELAGLDGLEDNEGELETGAMVRQRTLELSPGLNRQVPLLAAAIPFVGHREVRNRGTVGGSIAHADPSAELGLVAATLRATIVARASKSREIPGDEFVLGPFQTELAPDELLTAVRWPVAQPGDGHAFEEVARRHGDFALCGVAVQVRDAAARIGLMGVGPAPLVHQLGLEGSVDPIGMAEEIADQLEPSGDMHASGPYRKHLARVLVERCLRRAIEAAG
ncbi:MAG: FAD binding domain-containing protein [Solirubrobacterales bacterium]|nr:FAD binding domain-containing protein [Solirubrobacterales bacterium]